MEKVNFSNNQIGKRPRVAGETSSNSSIDASIRSVAVMRPSQEEEEEGRPASVATEGIEVKRRRERGSRGVCTSENELRHCGTVELGYV